MRQLLLTLVHNVNPSSVGLGHVVITQATHEVSAGGVACVNGGLHFFLAAVLSLFS